MVVFLLLLIQCFTRMNVICKVMSKVVLQWIKVSSEIFNCVIELYRGTSEELKLFLEQMPQALTDGATGCSLKWRRQCCLFWFMFKGISLETPISVPSLLFCYCLKLHKCCSPYWQPDDKYNLSWTRLNLGIVK